MVTKVTQVAPDLVLCTGDLTATATDAEFAGALELLSPLTVAYPFLCIPGNHDVYTGESVGRYSEYFGANEVVSVSTHGEIDIVRVDVCHPDWLSRGELGPVGLEKLDAALAKSERPALIAIHYPLRDRRGERYGPPTRALSDADAVETVLLKHARVKWLVHGHEHHGFRTEIPRAGNPITVIDPGAGGYAYLPERGRTAHFCVYEFAGSTLVSVERYRFDGKAFLAEPGGAFATGG